MASTTRLRARLGTGWLMVQPVAMSVMVGVQVALARRDAAVVSDQIDLHEPRGSIIPVREGADRDLVF